MSRPALQALMLFDNPAMYEDREVYERIHRLISDLMDKQSALPSFSKASMDLLEELTLGANEAVANSLKNTSANKVLQSTHDDLVVLLDEIKVAQRKCHQVH